jgi:tetratricopeptide (TPR) repeat protein
MKFYIRVVFFIVPFIGLSQNGEYSRYVKNSNFENIDSIIKFKSAFIENDSFNIDGYLSRGIIYFKCEMFELALKDFSKVIILDLKNSDAYSQRGFVYIRMGEFGLAVSDFEKAILLDRSNDNYWFGLGGALLFNGQPCLAVNSFTEAIKLDSVNYIYLAERGRSFIDCGDMKQGYEDIIKATEIKEDEFTLDALGWYYLNKSDFVSAISVYKKVLEITQNPVLYRNISFAYFNLENYKETVFYLDSAIEAYPKAIYYSERALTYWLIDSLQKAEEDFTQSIELDSNNYDGFHNRAFCIWFNIGEYEKALYDLEKAINIDSTQANVWNNLGYAKYKLGNINEAKRDVIYSLRIDNMNSNAHKNLALIYFELNNISESKRHLKRAIELGYKEDEEILRLKNKLETLDGEK